MSRRVDLPIWSAYHFADLSSPCPNCHAEPDVWCRRPDGRVRRTPCVARLRPQPSVPADPTEHAVPHDFNEPRHERN